MPQVQSPEGLQGDPVHGERVSSTYNPNGCIPQATNPDPVAISSSTNASPIAITTDTPHGFTTGDTVQVIGHDQTGANGLWVIAVTGASTFTLTGSTGTGVGTAIGQAQDYSVNPLLTLPGDGDLESASSVNAPIAGQANVAPWLYKRVGKYNLHQVYQTGTFTSQTTVISSTALVTGSWVDLTNLTNVFSASADRYLAAGDLLHVTFGTTVLWARLLGTLSYAFAIGLSLNGGSASAISSSVRGVSLDGSISPLDRGPIMLDCWIAGGFSANDRFDISIQANKDSAAAYNLQLFAGYSLSVEHYRSNG